MRPLPAILLLLVLTTGSCLANLGDSEEQCVARWGSVLLRKDYVLEGVNLHCLRFEKNEFTIFVGMIQDKADVVVWCQEDSSEFTPDQIAWLLGKNSDGNEWTKESNNSVSVFWDRDDGATAQYAPSHTLTFRSKDMLAASKAANLGNNSK